MDDHDLLVRVDEKLVWLIENLKDHKTEVTIKLKEVWDKIDEIEKDKLVQRTVLQNRLNNIEQANAKQAGFFNGAKFLWGVIGALPPSVAALILGIKTV